MKAKSNRRVGPSDRRRKRSGRRSPSEEEDQLWLTSWSALAEYLQQAPERLSRIEVAAKDQSKLSAMPHWMAYQGPVQINPELTHGFRAEVSLAELSEDELFAALAEQPVPLVLAVDQITDTRNLGAIARSAAFFGVPYLIMPRDRQAAITSASLAAAQGGFAYVSPIWVTNLSRCLRRLKDEAAYWVFGADMAGEAFAPGQLDHDRMVLVMGREDRGLRPLTKKTCDHLIGIAGAERRVESLNVAVATGICLHQLRAGIISQ